MLNDKSALVLASCMIFRYDIVIRRWQPVISEMCECNGICLYLDEIAFPSTGTGDCTECH